MLLNCLYYIDRGMNIILGKRVFLIIFLFLSICGTTFSQEVIPPQLFVAWQDVKKLTEDRAVLSIWIGVKNYKADSVTLTVPYIISADGERISPEYTVNPSYQVINPDNTGKLFNIAFSPDDIGTLESGEYTAVLQVSSLNTPELKENISFQIEASASIFKTLNDKLNWIRENIFSLLLSFFEMLLFILVIILLIRIIRNVLGTKKSLRILPVVDETGKGSEYSGIASGIDDLIQSKIQDIIRLISKSSVSRSAVLSNKNYNYNESQSGKFSPVDILKGSEDVDPQKIGDISVGMFKIPLGSLIVILSKMFGGNYVTGALQKYGATNKLILTLEQRHFLSLKKKSITLFESTWPSESVREENLADGIPFIIEELAYRLLIHVSHDIQTSHWKAYKHFLEGNVCFSRYEENNSRKDLLRDAILCWRESVRIDPGFAETHYNLGVALDRDNKIPDALFRYNRAVELGHEITKIRAYTNMARIYFQDLKDSGTALTLINKAKHIKTDYAELWNLEGLIVLNQLKDEDAAEKFRAAISLNKRTAQNKPDNIEPVYYYNLAVATYYLKNYEAAEKAGLTAYSLYSNIEKPGYLLQTLGLIFNQQNKFESAVKYFEEGLLKQPENRDMLDGYSTALFNLKLYDESEAVQKRLLRIYPEYSNGYLNFIRILKNKNYDSGVIDIYQTLGELLSSGKPDSILESLTAQFDNMTPDSLERKILSSALGSIYYFVRPDNKKAIKYLSPIFSGETPLFEQLFLAESHLTYGLVLLYEKNYDEAQLHLSKSISLLNDNQAYDLAVAYENLGDAYSKLSRNTDADSAYAFSVDYFKRINLNGRASDVYAKRASWLTGLKYYREAEDDCNKAIYLNNLNYNAYHYKGNIHYNLLKESEAIPQYEHSVEIYFDVPGTHYTMGLCHFYLGHYEEAVKKFETTIKLHESYTSPGDMNSPDAYQRLAMTYEKLGSYNNAEDTLRKAINLFPDKVKYKLLLARVLKNLKKYSDAVRELNSALHLDATNSQNFRHLVLNELADLYLEYGSDLQTAVKYIEEALTILRSVEKPTKQEQDDLILFESTFGWALFKQHKYDEAERILERTLSYFIGNAVFHRRLALVYENQMKNTQLADIKSDYKIKAAEQWNFFIEFSNSDNDREKGKEQLTKLMADK